MSYEIYKSIKQLEDGTFECVSASSNTTDIYGNRDFTRWIMKYFNETYPDVSNKLKRALLIMHSICDGSVFYPNNWKEDQRLANQFMRVKGYNHSKMYSDKNLMLQYAKEFLEYKQDNKKFGTLKQYVVNINNRYVERKTTRKCYMTPYKQCAKVYKAHDASELEEKFKGYKYGSNTVIVEEI